MDSYSVYYDKMTKFDKPNRILGFVLFNIYLYNIVLSDKSMYAPWVLRDVYALWPEALEFCKIVSLRA